MNIREEKVRKERKTKGKIEERWKDRKKKKPKTHKTPVLFTAHSPNSPLTHPLILTTVSELKL